MRVLVGTGTVQRVSTITDIKTREFRYRVSACVGTGTNVTRIQVYDCTHGYGTSVFAREYGYDWNPCTSTDPASVSVKYEKSEASSAPSARQTRLKRLVSPVTSGNKCTLSRTQRLRTERAFRAQ